MIRESHMVTDLILIYNGTVDVNVKGEKSRELKDGQFVGEMSFLTESPATGDCVVKHDTECLMWKQQVQGFVETKPISVLYNSRIT